MISPGSISSGRVATHTRNGLYGSEAQARRRALPGIWIAFFAECQQFVADRTRRLLSPCLDDGSVPADASTQYRDTSLVTGGTYPDTAEGMSDYSISGAR